MKKLLEKYGGAKHLGVPEEVKMTTKTLEEDLRSHAKAAEEVEKSGLIGISSKYNENVLFGNHTAVWGSYYDRESKKWGYKCCKCTEKST